ncbi:unnamed protein product [Paramecium pentaurelia]|uniref:Uncharacterized protein n=1 Tax=Paramecium pentaurelia TaxID=43138 RepID=A0A8S1T5D5_9CILI|nr:unnamed protein product [Paramecium pentaurelia]
MGQICKSVKLDQQLNSIETIQCSVPNDEADFCKPDNFYKFNKFLEQRHRNSNSTIDPLINGNINDYTIDQEIQQFRIQEQVKINENKEYRYQIPENSKSCIKSNNKDLKQNLKSKKKVSFNDFEFYNFSINPKFSSSSQEMI